MFLSQHYYQCSIHSVIQIKHKCFYVTKNQDFFNFQISLNDVIVAAQVMSRAKSLDKQVNTTINMPKALYREGFQF